MLSRRSRNVDQSRTHVRELPFEIGVRSLGGLRFEADGESGGFEPAEQESMLGD